ncbi:Uncharacterized protein TCM_021733 [Theobroma cacao]|uniref:Uncharacterized protein n=1 Tax=Theobroma cacao TaxID=3641 RepID=A0A061EYD7_THECC|nr:Uncharacterized protein TCM_021733 [Theobroma cacao]
MAGHAPSHPLTIPSPSLPIKSPTTMHQGFWPPTPWCQNPPSPGCPNFWTTRLFKKTHTKIKGEIYQQEDPATETKAKKTNTKQEKKKRVRSEK